MKNKKILIISLCAVLIALVAAASVMLKRNSISKHSLIYADVNDNKLISYKISEKAETRISFDGYSEYLLVGKYIGGEYCCVSKGENSFYDVLLIKNGNIEKTYQLSFCPDEIAATDDGIYCLTNGKIYRLSTADNTENLYKDNVYTHNYHLNMLITDKGDLVYSRQENDGNVSLVLDCDGQETDVFTFNPDDTIDVGLNTDNRFLYKDKSGNYKTMAVSVYGGKQQKYGKSATFV